MLFVGTLRAAGKGPTDRGLRAFLLDITAPAEGVSMGVLLHQLALKGDARDDAPGCDGRAFFNDRGGILEILVEASHCVLLKLLSLLLHLLLNTASLWPVSISALGY